MSNAIESAFAAADDSLHACRESIKELSELTSQFFSGPIAALDRRIDPHTGEEVQYVVFTADIPRAFRRKATEALTSARHSFDQSLYAAHGLLTGSPRKSIYYPWARTPVDLEGLLVSRKIPEQLHATIRAHAPYFEGENYAGGDDLIRGLAQIANNKHTVGLAVDFNVAGLVYPDVRATGSLSMLGTVWDAKRREAELMRWRGDIEMNGPFRFAFNLSLSDRSLPAPVNLADSLERFRQSAETVFRGFKDACVART